MSLKAFLLGLLIIPAKENKRSTGAEEVKGVFTFLEIFSKQGYFSLKFVSVTVGSFMYIKYSFSVFFVPVCVCVPVCE